MKYLFCLLLLAANLGYAQSINDRWIGTWQAGKSKLVVTPTAFSNCQWVNKVTSASKKCLAYYNGKITKNDMLSNVQSDLTNINDWLKQKMITPKDYQEMKRSIEESKKILDQVSNDTFRTIYIDAGEYGNPDGGSVYFLDKEFVYETSHVEGGMGPTFSITQYRKN